MKTKTIQKTLYSAHGHRFADYLWHNRSKLQGWRFWEFYAAGCKIGNLETFPFFTGGSYRTVRYGKVEEFYMSDWPIGLAVQDGDGIGIVLCNAGNPGGPVNLSHYRFLIGYPPDQVAAKQLLPKSGILNYSAREEESWHLNPGFQVVREEICPECGAVEIKKIESIYWEEKLWKNLPRSMICPSCNEVFYIMPHVSYPVCLDKACNDMGMKKAEKAAQEADRDREAEMIKTACSATITKGQCPSRVIDKPYMGEEYCALCCRHCDCKEVPRPQHVHMGTPLSLWREENKEFVVVSE